MPTTNAFEADLLNLILNNANIANLGDATGVRGSTAAGSIYISLHTASPGASGTQTTSEVAYTGYARVAVARSAAWTVTPGNPTTGTNNATVTFPACTAGSATATHFGIGTSSSGAGGLIASGALGASLAISAGITPQAAASTLNFNAVEV
jgi:hypothetical protein